MVPLVFVFKHYGVFLDVNSRKAACPLKSHKGGKESTPSFYFYPETNSFFCYGCKIGGKYAHAVEFVASIDGLSKIRAAEKILQLFSQDIDVDNVYDEQNFSERLETMLDFSQAVIQFRGAHSDQKSYDFIETYVCRAYDKINAHYKLDNAALKRAVEELKAIMLLYRLEK